MKKMKKILMVTLGLMKILFEPSQRTNFFTKNYFLKIFMLKFVKIV